MCDKPAEWCLFWLWPCLQSAEWAAWVQAIGSIFAIVGAIGIALWQMKKQQLAGIQLLHEEKRLAQLEAATALYSLCTGALQLLKLAAKSFPDRSTVHDVADGRKFFDFGELRVVENSIQSISLHALPADFVRLTMMSSSAVRQFRENLEFAIENHRTLDAAAFGTLFSSLDGLPKSLELTCSDIAAAIERIRLKST